MTGSKTKHQWIVTLFLAGSVDVLVLTGSE
jgi:hypothetical protein